MRTYVPMNLRGMLTADNIAQELEKVQVYLRQFDGIFNVTNGNPVPGPNPPGIVTNPLDNYFYLPGRTGGQIAYFDTNASGIGVLSSTRNATKGSIYLGSARTSIFVETTQRLGLKTASPSARLHVVGDAPTTEIRLPISDNTSASGAGWQDQAANPIIVPGNPAYALIDESTSTLNDADYMQSTTSSSYYVNMSGGTGTPGVGTTVTLKVRVSVTSGTTTVFFDLQENATTTKFITTSGVLAGVTTSPATFSLTLTAAEVAGVSNWSNLQFKFFRSGTNMRVHAAWIEVTGGGTSGKTAIFQTVASQIETLSEWQNSAGTSLLTVTAAGRLIVESGGSFRHVPGAAASTLFKGDANGDASWGTINLLSAYVADTLAASVVAGDIIIGNATPKWSRLGVGSNGNVLTVVAGLPAWQAPASPTNALLDGANHTDTVAQTVSRGSLIYGNSTPKWDELVIGAANTVLRSDGTDVSWGAIDHNYISNRTRTMYFKPSEMVGSNSPAAATLSVVGSAYPANYHAWTFATAAASGSNRAVLMSFDVPADWVSGTDMTIYAYTTKTAGGADAGGYEVGSSYISRASGESLTAAVTTNATTNCPSSTTHQLDIRSIGTISGATLAAGEHVKLHIIRDTDQEIANLGSATNNTMGLVGVRIDYTAVM